MKKSNELKIIARIKTDFPEKFGIPRQSGLIPSLKGRIIFEPEYRNPDALRGIEGYSHLWLLWEFSQAKREEWSPTVRPPRLGGNTRMGVFATRSPFRPNHIGLSSVKLEEIRKNTENGTELIVSGVDMLDDTPIYDIKPYIAYTDSHPNAVGGFSTEVYSNNIQVIFIKEEFPFLDENTYKEILGILQQDPRPAYQNDPQRIYCFSYKEYSISFQVENQMLRVISITK